MVKHVLYNIFKKNGLKDDPNLLTLNLTKKEFASKMNQSINYIKKIGNENIESQYQEMYFHFNNSIASIASQDIIIETK